MQTLVRQELEEKFIYFCLYRVFAAAAGFLSCGEWGLLFIAVASLLAEHGSRAGAQ